MRTIVPGQVSPTYLKAVFRNQQEFYQSITMSEAEAEKARDAWPPSGRRWVPKKRENGPNPAEH